MTLKTIKTGLFILTISLSAFLNAQVSSDGKHKQRDSEKLFKKLDKNHDGALSFEEFITRKKSSDNFRKTARKRFNLIDSNTNNRLSLEEFKAKKQLIKEQRIAQRFALMDSNSNGNITLEEYTAFVKVTKEKRKRDKHKN